VRILSEIPGRPFQLGLFEDRLGEQSGSLRAIRRIPGCSMQSPGRTAHPEGNIGKNNRRESTRPLAAWILVMGRGHDRRSAAGELPG
jgi:hypothetical protein